MKPPVLNVRPPALCERCRRVRQAYKRQVMKLRERHPRILICIEPDCKKTFEARWNKRAPVRCPTCQKRRKLEMSYQRTLRYREKRTGERCISY